MKRITDKMNINKRILCLLLACSVFAAAGCSAFDSGNDISTEEQQESEPAQQTNVPQTFPSDEKDTEESVTDPVDSIIAQYLSTMTLEEKVAQLFIVTPEALIDGVDHVTAAGDMTKEAINDIPVGGFIYLSDNLKSVEQVQSMLSNVQTYSMERIGLPALLCVDEEGGTVARIAGNNSFGVDNVGDMAQIGATNDADNAYSAGNYIGAYLSDLGFNVDFAPVADVLSNPDNQVVKKRSFGSDTDNVSQMALAFSNGLMSQGIAATYKHFPGHGATLGDTHEGYAYTDKTLDELMECELLPFQEGIDNGIEIIMAGHISLPNVLGDHTPASMSREILTDLLRNEMGYDGIIITDALNMGAITQQYSSAEAAITAINAGADLILMPEDFGSAYQGVLDAAANDEIPLERIDESLVRILRLKLKLMGLD